MFKSQFSSNLTAQQTAQLNKINSRNTEVLAEIKKIRASLKTVKTQKTRDLKALQLKELYYELIVLDDNRKSVYAPVSEVEIIVPQIDDDPMPELDAETLAQYAKEDAELEAMLDASWNTESAPAIVETVVQPVKLSKAQEKAIRALRDVAMYAYDARTEHGIARRTLDALIGLGLVEVYSNLFSLTPDGHDYAVDVLGMPEFDMVAPLDAPEDDLDYLNTVLGTRYEQPLHLTAMIEKAEWEYAQAVVDARKEWRAINPSVVQNWDSFLNPIRKIRPEENRAQLVDATPDAMTQAHGATVIEPLTKKQVKELLSVHKTDKHRPLMRLIASENGLIIRSLDKDKEQVETAIATTATTAFDILVDGRIIALLVLLAKEEKPITLIVADTDKMNNVLHITIKGCINRMSILDPQMVKDTYAYQGQWEGLFTEKPTIETAPSVEAILPPTGVLSSTFISMLAMVWDIPQTVASLNKPCLQLAMSHKWVQVTGDMVIITELGKREAFERGLVRGYTAPFATATHEDTLMHHIPRIITGSTSAASGFKVTNLVLTPKDGCIEFSGNIGRGGGTIAGDYLSDDHELTLWYTDAARELHAYQVYGFTLQEEVIDEIR